MELTVLYPEIPGMAGYAAIVAKGTNALIEVRRRLAPVRLPKYINMCILGDVFIKT